MATGQLGKAARISYESKNRVSGLTDITTTIQRPDGVDLGPFNLVEYKPGFYKYDFITTLTDLEGDYLGFINSPTESHSAHFKLSLFKAISGGSGDVQITGCDPLVGKLAKIKLIGVAKKIEPLKGSVSRINLLGQSENVEPLNGKIKDANLRGVVNKE